MFDRIDTIGHFWLASASRKKVPGRLVFDSNRMRLDVLKRLQGPFTGPVSLGSLSQDKVLIYGVTEGRHIILADCQRIYTLHSDMLGTDTYRVGSVIRGLEPRRSRATAGPGFDYMSITLSTLSDWIGRIDTSITGLNTRRFSVNYQTRMLAESQFSQGTVGLLITYTIHGFGSQPVTSEHRIVIRLHHPRPLDELRRLRFAIQNLLTIATNSPSLVTEVRVGSNGREGTWSEYTPGDNLTTVDTTPLGLHPFSYADMGRAKGIAKWLDLYLAYRPAINSLVSPHYMGIISPETRFLNLITAIESMAISKDAQFARTRDVKKRVGYIANQLSKSIFKDLVNGHIEEWVSQVTKIRHNWVAHGTNTVNIDYRVMTLFSDSLHYLGLIWLLRECGMPRSVFAQIQQRGTFAWLKARMNELLP